MLKGEFCYGRMSTWVEKNVCEVPQQAFVWAGIIFWQQCQFSSVVYFFLLYYFLLNSYNLISQVSIIHRT